eukprot:SAG31_NODE_4147_length_3531_cov_1.458333_3_plen_91_part_00
MDMSEYMEQHSVARLIGCPMSSPASSASLLSILTQYPVADRPLDTLVMTRVVSSRRQSGVIPMQLSYSTKWRRRMLGFGACCCKYSTMVV